MIYLNDATDKGEIEQIKELALPTRLNKAKTMLPEKQYEALVISYALLKIGLYQESHFYLSDTTQFIFDKNGKSHIKDCPLHFSYAYDIGVACAVIDIHPVGIEVYHHFDVKEKMLDLVLTNDEKAFNQSDNEYFFYCYLAKESYFKYLGKNHGLIYQDIDLSYFSSDLFRFQDKNFFYLNHQDYSLCVCNEGELFASEHIKKYSNKEILEILKVMDKENR